MPSETVPDTRRLPGLPEGSDIRYFSLGRHALAAALEALSIGKGHKVLMPEFICRDLLSSVRAVNAEPVFYPVNRFLCPESLPVAQGIKTVIAVNYFGFPQALEIFQDFCAAQGIALIEDNAHGYLSRDASGNLLGGRGDLGLVSLRKTFALPDGAVLMINNHSRIDKMPVPSACRSESLSPGFVLKNVLRRIQQATEVRVLGSVQLAARRLRKIRTGSALPRSLQESEYVIPGPAAIHCESLKILGRVDPVLEVVRRRALYRRFQRELASLAIDPLFDDLSPGVAPYGYPFRAEPNEAAKAVKLALDCGLDCFRWPDLPATVAQSAPEHYKDVWWINFSC